MAIKNRHGRQFVGAIHRLHDRVKPGKQGTCGKQIGQQIDATPLHAVIAPSI